MLDRVAVGPLARSSLTSPSTGYKRCGCGSNVSRISARLEVWRHPPARRYDSPFSKLHPAFERIAA